MATPRYVDILIRKRNTSSGSVERNRSLTCEEWLRSRSGDANRCRIGMNRIQPTTAPIAIAIAHLMRRLRSSTRCSSSDIWPVSAGALGKVSVIPGSTESAGRAVDRIDDRPARCRLGHVIGRGLGPVVAGDDLGHVGLAHRRGGGGGGLA